MSKRVSINVMWKFDIIKNWCNENIGAEYVKWRWYYSTKLGYHDFEIDREEDATMFILRWK